MRVTEFLQAEWRPALGCTEPAAVAWAASLAAAQASGPVRRVRLRCDARTYKNCYAVGIPNSERKTGILWALGIGAHLHARDLGLRCFEAVDGPALVGAAELLEAGGAVVDVDRVCPDLLIDCTVVRAGGVGRAVLQHDHTRLVRLESDGRVVGGEAAARTGETDPSIREQLAGMTLAELVELAGSPEPEDRDALRRGAAMNIAIARHGLSLFPARFVDPSGQDSLTRLSRLVAAGVFARMSGEPFVVMSLAGSGNKGITASVPIALWGREAGFGEDAVDEALALACLVTSATTHHLGTLSAVCGGAVAAGIGIAAGLVHLEGGGVREISLGVNTMVGNVTGMICDGAKIGCGMKAMTGVDAAFRAASLALSGIGIPVSDGIVGEDAEASLANLGRVATRGMLAVDAEILDNMQAKLRA
jgi:L-cysteine desulfidase